MRLLQAEGSGNKETIVGKEVGWLLQLPSFRECRVYQADCLIVLITSFLTDWLKVPFMGELKL